jgi:hypothetical protein
MLFATSFLRMLIERHVTRDMYPGQITRCFVAMVVAVTFAFTIGMLLRLIVAPSVTLLGTGMAAAPGVNPEANVASAFTSSTGFVTHDDPCNLRQVAELTC